MTADDDSAGAFRGASFTGADFTGAKFRDCDLRQVKITDSWLVDVNVSGLVDRFVVNDVDVTAFVEGELDRRHPERVQLRAVRTAGDYRAMWETIERLWSDTIARAGRLPEPALGLRVEDEWSFIETLRHLVFATDAWAGRAILDEPMPYHRFGLPSTGYPPADATALGLDPGARPSLAEVMEVRASRMTLVRGIIDGLTDASMERVCLQPPSPLHPEETRTVGRCLRVIMREECEHRRYALRDLAALEAGHDHESRLIPNGAGPAAICTFAARGAHLNVASPPREKNTAPMSGRARNSAAVPANLGAPSTST